MNRTPLVAALLCTAAATVPSSAEHPTQGPQFVVFMSGLQEVGPDGTLGAGDPDGTAVATLEEDHGTLVWTLDYRNISGQSISGLHIHGPSATPTTNRPVFIDFPLLIDFPAPGIPLPDGTIFGTVSSADDAQLPAKLRQVFEAPAGFYINLHTAGAGGFPDGAVRGQLPEPSAVGACAVAGAAVLLRRRPRRR